MGTHTSWNGEARVEVGCKEAPAGGIFHPKLLPASSLTFEHLHGDFGDPCRFVFVDPDGLGQNHLTKAAFAQRLPQSQPEDDKQTVSRYRSTLNSRSLSLYLNLKDRPRRRG